MKISVAEFDMFSLLIECRRVIDILLKDKPSVRTEWICDQDLIIISDKERLKRVLLNL